MYPHKQQRRLSGRHYKMNVFEIVSLFTANYHDLPSSLPEVSPHEISPLALQLCLFLACSRTQKVPAFIFFRPCFPRNRWTRSGELEVMKPIDMVLKFKPMLRRSFGATQLPHSSHFPSSAIGFYTPATEISAGLLRESSSKSLSLAPCPVWCFGEDLQYLIREGYVAQIYTDNLIYLTLDDHLREKLRARSGPKVLLQATLDLIRWVAWALPDPYSEPLWEILSRHCREIIQTTVFPFFRGIYEEERHELDLFPL
jgi:hypothetical protein